MSNNEKDRIHNCLQKLNFYRFYVHNKADSYYKLLDEAIYIIKDLFEKNKEYEYNGYNISPDDDWIPCSEILPDPMEDCLVTVYYNNIKQKKVTISHLEYGSWLIENFSCKVLAWQPLPHRYHSET